MLEIDINRVSLLVASDIFALCVVVVDLQGRTASLIEFSLPTPQDMAATYFGFIADCHRIWGG